ncbi:hypothetical protein FYK55_20050 [Roseiconus nitratireducens]|uniref:Uncharacterized protein n=1 Tax=Roseiconus nitratireducens TaxID=2605748 RepID=A0A5M6CZL4_9BACT|nr:hypothetical protein [Roseiconus nitratireducens]KAA5540687.1 hypothetical protein FYK55_20050 [Roseiconus nitratireducens]
MSPDHDHDHDHDDSTSDPTAPGEPSAGVSAESRVADPTGRQPIERVTDEGPGCLPGCMAAAVLSGILAFIACAFGTWVLYQKRSELALRTVRGTYLPLIEQSRLPPDEKQPTAQLLAEFGDKLQNRQVEDWQAAGVMQRLTRLPILEWGQIRAVEAFVDTDPADFADDASQQFDRLRHGVERGQLTAIDFRHILSPVTRADDTSDGTILIEPLETSAVQEVVQLARQAADRGGVADNPKGDVTIDTLVRRQIEAGMEQGSF